MCFAAWFAKRQLVCILLPFAVIIAAYAVYAKTLADALKHPITADDLSLMIFSNYG